MLISARTLPGKHQKERPRVFIDGGNLSAGLLQFFLQLEGIALNGKIQVADGKSADNVADRAAGEVEDSFRRRGQCLAPG